MLKFLTLTMIQMFAFQIFAQPPYKVVKPLLSPSSGQNPFFSLIRETNVSGVDEVETFVPRVIRVYSADRLVASYWTVVDSSVNTKEMILKVDSIVINDSLLLNGFKNSSDSIISKGYMVKVSKLNSNQIDSSELIQFFPFDVQVLDSTSEKRKDKKRNAVSIKGRVTIEAQGASSQYPAQQLPELFVRSSVLIEPTVWGVPFDLSYFYTSETNTMPNNISNVKLSFNQDKFMRSLTEKLEEKRRTSSLGSDGRMNSSKENVNAEYLKLRNKLNSQSYLNRINRSRDIVKYGDVDTTFKHSFRYKKARLDIDEMSIDQVRMQKLDSIIGHYDEVTRINNIELGVDKYNTYGSEKKLKKKLKKSGLLSPLEGVLMDIKQFDLGTFAPSYNLLVLNGSSINGFNIEINRGLFYGAFVSGKTFSNHTNYATPYSSGNILGREIIAARLGVGHLSRFLVSTTVLKGVDGNTSATDSLNRYVPGFNYVVGLDLKYKTNVTEFGVEYAKSLNADDLGVNRSHNDYFINNILDNKSTNKSNALSAYGNVQLKVLNTSVKFATRLIDPYYYSFGTPYLRQDNFRTEFKVIQSLFKNKIVLTTSFRRDEDNLYNQKQGASVFYSTTFIANIKINKYPFLSLLYSPSSQRYFNFYNTKYSQHKVELGQATLSYLFRKKTYFIAVSTTFLRQRSIVTEIDLQQLNNVQYGTNISYNFLPQKLIIAYEFFQTIAVGDDSTNTIHSGISLSKEIMKGKCTISLGQSYRSDFWYGNRFASELGMVMSIIKNVSINLRLEKHWIRMDNNKSKIEIGRISIVKNF